MVWIEVHQTLVRHRKTLRLATELGTTRHRTIGLLVDLWCWAIDNAPDGDLSHITEDALGRALEWRGAKLKRSLRTAGFLDSDSRIHDWEDYAGRLVEQRRANAVRMREKRRQQNKAHLEVVQ